MREVYDGHLRRRQKTDRRTPCAGPPADIQRGMFADIRITGKHRIVEPRQDREGEYLALMDVPRELKVEKPRCLGVNERPVFEKKGESVRRQS